MTPKERTRKAWAAYGLIHTIVDVLERVEPHMEWLNQYGDKLTRKDLRDIRSLLAEIKGKCL